MPGLLRSGRLLAAPAALFVRNGFRCEGRTEVILVADVADLPAGSEAPFET